MLEPRSSEFSQACHAIYEKIAPELEKTHRGKIVAVEPVSGEHFIGSDVEEALAAANAKYPGRPVFFYRVGYRAVYKLSSMNNRLFGLYSRIIFPAPSGAFENSPVIHHGERQANGFQVPEGRLKLKRFSHLSGT